MKLKRTKTFVRQFQKLSAKLQDQFAERLRLWLTDPTHTQLRVHPLQGEYKGYWSMNIRGDLRALYYYEAETVVVFALIGTHSQLYK